jgi:hypothetical protein
MPATSWFVFSSLRDTHLRIRKSPEVANTIAMKSNTSPIARRWAYGWKFVGMRVLPLAETSHPSEPAMAEPEAAKR